jgi:hypothetical protein
VDVFVADATGPELTAYSFNMNNGTVALTFSEVVTVNSFAASSLIFQRSLNTPLSSEQVRLSAAGTTVSTRLTAW